MNTIQVTPDLQLDKATEKLFELKSDEESYKIIPNEFKVDNTSFTQIFSVIFVHLIIN